MQISTFTQAEKNQIVAEQKDPARWADGASVKTLADGSKLVRWSTLNSRNDGPGFTARWADGSRQDVAFTNDAYFAYDPCN